MTVFTGCCFFVSWLSSFSMLARRLESSFYEQLIELGPALNLATSDAVAQLSTGLHQLTLLAVFCLIWLHVMGSSRKAPTPVFIILVVFVLFMLQLLLAVLQHIWLPVVWASLAFVITTSMLFVWAHLPQIKSFIWPSPVLQIPQVRECIQQQDYNTAVLLLKNGEFTDESFDLAYDLGQKLEQEKNWALARVLYSWLVQHDPGMQDFIERIDQITNQSMEQDLSLTDVTESRDLFGHFQLLGKKALGATATVYEAYDLNTHQRIALKILNQRLNDDTGERDIMTFLHEAMTVSQLDHPNIVRIHDADILGEQAYIAMDYIAGYPMSERLRRKKLLTAAESLRIMRSVLNALEVAHHKGIVHGDIKPANIMYDQNRKSYIITDFGAAYSYHRLVDGPAGEKKITGTPAYMSPEQLKGARIDGRSDLFSLAVTIYHLLSGRQPFKGDKLSELKTNILNQAVDMDQLSVPDSIKQILQKALQKKTYQRFADASQMLHSVLYCEQKLLKK
jgi:serine/threonine-protein kinase